MNILEAVNDPELFAPYFKNTTSWKNWFVVLAGIFGLPLDADQQNVFAQLTGRLTQLEGHSDTQSESGFDETWLIVGRRGGKSYIAALIAVYLAAFFDYSKYLSKGEIGTVMIIAVNRKQARIIFRYVEALFDGVPMLRNMVIRKDREIIELDNSIAIEVHTASFRSTRGYTVVSVLADEIAYWMDDTSANPDSEILAALRPAMATIPNAKIIAMSSPYRQSGVMYDAYRRYFGNSDNDVLVVQADSITMNPAIPQKVIDKAYERDPVSAAAEYGAEFRSDIAGFLDGAWIEQATRDEATDLPPMKNIQYKAFVDPSGGSRDAFTLGIGHVENDRCIVDLVREVWPPFLPESVVQDYAALLKAYRIHTATGDRYGSEWVVQSFKKYGIQYQHSTKSKSVIYMDALPMFAQGSVEIPNNTTLIRQLRNLERRTSRAGQDSIDHPPNAHDDLANACCGVLAFLNKPKNELRYIDLFTGRDVTDLYTSKDPFMQYFM